MIFLLHGANAVRSRQRLTELRGLYADNAVSEYRADQLNYSDFILLFQNISLFAEKRLVVVEGKLDGELAKLEIIGANESVDLVIWSEVGLRSNDKLLSQVKAVGGSIALYEEADDISVFPFLDAVGARKRKQALSEYQKLVQDGQSAIYLLTMVVWQMRMLLVPDLAKGQVQRKALEYQKNFSFEELRWIFYQLLLLEVAFKTGETIPEVALEQLVYKITR